ncbi:hypothetical protein SPBR_00999 [Sporothrix brasiliensis 5110]|uniref:Ribosomal protein S21 n=1 Tax=Sporothrix brasiliensis 5110 TaxID=1398154 RepID=A0A0C2IXT8_9PEZI|nr:uncharacterized protein SPBR_00999 [Sporothrix brasiliensis 5110]KIH89852.1 hypothetical protein SPBR_00999 [Sporothrix brasiliensis 5110]
MDFSRLARTALSASTSTTATASSTFARMFGAARPGSPPFALCRSLSTTPMRLAPPRQSGQDAQPAWPPKREATTPPTGPSSASASPSSSTTAAPDTSNPLKDMYSSDSPAQWANWSSNDFSARNGLSSFDMGLSARSSRSAHSDDTRFRLSPETGRTVYVAGNVDAAQAFMLLNVLCTRNRVQADFQKQRFHERQGLRRKRLNWERRRDNFRRGLRAYVDRVQELTRQGW